MRPWNKKGGPRSTSSRRTLLKVDVQRLRFAAVREARWRVGAGHQLAEARLIARGSLDVSSRLTAWDETPLLESADLSIDTSQTDASAAAKLIHHWLTRPPEA
jgi:hypothetical protein